MTGLVSTLRQVALRHGMAVFGVADLEFVRPHLACISPEIGAEYIRALVLGYPLHRSVIETVTNQPTAIYFHHYRQVNYALDRAGLEVAMCIEKGGFRALAIPASQYVSRNPMRGHISHRLLGWAAGLGWIGRSTLLVHPGYGSQVRYASILTDAPFPAGTPLEGNCGLCRRCIEACPAGAIKEDSTNFGLALCTAKLTEFSKLPHIGQHICGVCVKACPAPLRNRRESRAGAVDRGR